MHKWCVLLSLLVYLRPLLHLVCTSTSFSPQLCRQTMKMFSKRRFSQTWATASGSWEDQINPIPTAWENPTVFFLPLVVQSHAEQVHSLCIVTFKMLLLHLTYFCWHVFAFCFTIMLTCELGSLRAGHFAFSPSISLWKGYILKLSTRHFLVFKHCLQAVNRWASTTGGGFGGLTPSSVWNWNELISYRAL